MRGLLAVVLGLVACGSGKVEPVSASDTGSGVAETTSTSGSDTARFGYACWSTQDFGYGAVRFDAYQASTGAAVAQGWVELDGSLSLHEEWDRREDGQPSARRYVSHEYPEVWHGHTYTYEDDVLVRVDFELLLDGVFEGGADYTWRADGQLISVQTDSNGDGAVDYATTYTYDDSGRPLQRVESDDDGPYLTFVYEWTDELAYTLVEHLGIATGPVSERTDVRLDDQGRTLFSEEDWEPDRVWDMRNTTEFGPDYMRNVREQNDAEDGVKTWESEELYDGWKTVASSSVATDADGSRIENTFEWTWGCD
jgi:hypothetical protein